MYKLSNYNYYIPYNDRIIYFNGISNEIFSLNTNEHERMQLLFSDLISFEINYNSVFNRFKKWGFIIDENIDQIKLLLYKNKMSVFNDRNYMLVLNPTLECNFNCWYCYEEHPIGSMSSEVMEKIKK